MRYMNWDVLVFPEAGDTKTPLQEFSTTCTVIQDPGKQSTNQHLRSKLIESSLRQCCNASTKPCSLLQDCHTPFAYSLMLRAQSTTWHSIQSLYT